MNIDLTGLVTNAVDAINVNLDVSYDAEMLNSANIRKLLGVTFVGRIRRLYDSYEIGGVLSGVMVLPDDVTLEDVNYEFNVDVLENFDEAVTDLDNKLVIVNNNLDISDFLWQNIVLEIPMKVVSDKNKDITLEGKGWRFVKEEDLIKEKENESPFDVLDDKFDLKEGEDKDGSSS